MAAGEALLDQPTDMGLDRLALEQQPQSSLRVRKRRLSFLLRHLFEQSEI
ncbi:MAG: hypothetical protein WBU92_00020 [Candidatus Dormiibacterota bacterium]